MIDAGMHISKSTALTKMLHWSLMVCSAGSRWLILAANDCFPEDAVDVTMCNLLNSWIEGLAFELPSLGVQVVYAGGVVIVFDRLLQVQRTISWSTLILLHRFRLLEPGSLFDLGVKSREQCLLHWLTDWLTDGYTIFIVLGFNLGEWKLLEHNLLIWWIVLSHWLSGMVKFLAEFWNACSKWKVDLSARNCERVDNSVSNGLGFSGLRRWKYFLIDAKFSRMCLTQSGDGICFHLRLLLDFGCLMFTMSE